MNDKRISPETICFRCEKSVKSLQKDSTSFYENTPVLVEAEISGSPWVRTEISGPPWVRTEAKPEDIHQ
jgi:hypothetical protein